MSSNTRTPGSPAVLENLNRSIGAEDLAKIRDIFACHGLKFTEATRIALKIFAAALPVLARGGKIVFKEPDSSTERGYSFLARTIERHPCDGADELA